MKTSQMTRLQTGAPAAAFRPHRSAASALQRIIDASPRQVSEREKVRKFGGSMVQRVIDTSLDGMHAVNSIPNNEFQGLPPFANKTVKKIQSTTAPADPPGMSDWKSKGYLADPSKLGKQALTRMHAIRGKFGGPSAANNMFLGTALSNNFHGNSHFSEVEKPLESYLTGGKKGETRAFDYTVQPNFGVIPGYMEERLDEDVADGDVAGFRAFAEEHIPDGFTCTADLYRRGDGTLEHKVVEQDVATDVGAQSTGPRAPSVATKAMASGGYHAASRAAIGAGLGGLLALVAGGPVGWSVALAGLGGAAYGYATSEYD